MAKSGSYDEQNFSRQISSARPLILICGLGNPLLGDDGVGWAIATEIQSRLAAIHEYLEPTQKYQVEIDRLSLGGLSLMERLAGCQKAILIDAIVTGNNPMGTVIHFDMGDLPIPLNTGHLSSAHDVSLPTAMDVGRSIGIQLPDQIIIVAVESQITYEFSDKLSSAVAAAVPQAAALTIQLLDQMIRN
jgi:hydrogenase maturation protease